MVPQKLPAGSVIEARVARLTKFGAFVRLGERIEGFVHISIPLACCSPPPGASVILRFALIDSPDRTRGTSDNHMPRAKHDERRLFQAGYAHRTRD